MLIDTHSHLQYYFNNLSEELACAPEVACGIVAGGTLECVPEVIKTADAAGWAMALGLHPLYVNEITFASLEEIMRTVIRLKDDPRLAAIGEIGLDHYAEALDQKLCERAFTAQLSLAQELSLPVTVHSRHALGRTMDILKTFPLVGGALHAFSGSREMARIAIDRGWCLGVGGAVTYEGSKKVREAVRYAPLDALVLETDAPDMPGAGIAEKKSHLRHMLRYAQIIANLKKTDVETVCRITTGNALRAFPRLKVILEAKPQFKVQNASALAKELR